MTRTLLLKPISKGITKVNHDDTERFWFAIIPINYQGQTIGTFECTNLDATNLTHVGWHADILNNDLKDFLHLEVEENDLSVTKQVKYGIEITRLDYKNANLPNGRWYNDNKDLTFNLLPNEKVKVLRNDYLELKVRSQSLEEGALISPTVDTIIISCDSPEDLNQLKQSVAVQSENGEWRTRASSTPIKVKNVDLAEIEFQNTTLVLNIWNGLELPNIPRQNPVKPNPGAENTGNQQPRPNSEARQKVLEVYAQGNEIVNSNNANDIPKMKQIIKQLEDIQNKGSVEEKAELKEWAGEDLIKELKGKVTALELVNQPEIEEFTPPPTQEKNTKEQKEQPTKDNVLPNDLNNTENETITPEQKIKIIKQSGSLFGEETPQQQTYREELEEKLAEENLDLYLQVTTEVVKKNITENNLTDEKLELNSELRNQWESLKAGEIKDKGQAKEITRKVNERIIQQSVREELAEIRKRVEKSYQGNLDNIQREELIKDIKTFIKKSKTNSYKLGEVKEAQEMLKKIEATIYQRSISQINKNPFRKEIAIPIIIVALLAIGTVVAIVIRSKKVKK